MSVETRFGDKEVTSVFIVAASDVVRAGLQSLVAGDGRAAIVALRPECLRRVGCMRAARHPRAEAEDRRRRSEAGDEQNDGQCKRFAVHR